MGGPGLMLNNSKTRCDEGGLALVSVLWILVLLTVLSTSLVVTARVETRLAGNLLAQSQARHAAQGAIDLAVERIRAPGGARWPVNGAIQEERIGEITVFVSVIDETGKFDLNMAPKESLVRLLQMAGTGESQLQSLSDAILDWRDTDVLRRLNGAEAEEYSAASLSYRPANRKFNNIEELRLVLGVTDSLFEQLEPLITVHSKSPYVNLSVANDQIRNAIEENTQSQGYSGNAESAYTIEVHAQHPAGAVSVLTAIVVPATQSARTPYEVVSWRDRLHARSLVQLHVERKQYYQQREERE